MMGKTHLVVGIATALAFACPNDKESYIAAVIGGATGGIMADIDVRIDCSNRYARKASLDALYGEIVAVVLSVVLLWMDYLNGCTIWNHVVDHWLLAIVGVIFLIAFIVWGECSVHRDRTHSLAAMLLSSGSVLLIQPEIGTAFCLGYASHLAIDLLNKSPVRLFYPVKKGFCLKVCYADRLADTILFAFALCLIFSYSIAFLFAG